MSGRQLKEWIFHSKIGTIFEKFERISELAKWARREDAPEGIDTVLRAAYLCKADLVSGVVCEFPELQGVMGKTYALLQGEPQRVGEVIFEHYLPNRAGGPIPESVEGSIVSIADKIDTIAACFGVGLIPTGTADPFALRRQTLGIIRIVLEKPFRISLGGLLDKALGLLAPKLVQPAENVRRDILDFFQGRLHHYLVSQEGFSPDIIEAALSIGIDDLVDAVERTKALAGFTGRPDVEPIATAFKRVGNIIKEPEQAPVDSGLLRIAAEQALFEAVRETESVVGGLFAKSAMGALENHGPTQSAIDGFSIRCS